MLLRAAAQGEIAQGAQVSGKQRRATADSHHHSSFVTQQSTIGLRASLQTSLSLCQICTENLQTFEFKNSTA
jgi:hypothetical protein